MHLIKTKFISIVLIVLINNGRYIGCMNTVWKWNCNEGYCKKTLIEQYENEDEILSLAECRLLCSQYAGLWPKPTGEFNVHHELVVIDANQINFYINNELDNPVSRLFIEAGELMKRNILREAEDSTKQTNEAYRIDVIATIQEQASTQLTLTTDESYILKADAANGTMMANITAKSFFGARHALETLGQLIVFDSLRNIFKMPKTISVSDAPAFPYRGILLDTSRNFISLDTIKRILDGMAASKLNTFHWHLTDSHSFPYESRSLPNLSKYGAYSPKKIYTPTMISSILQYARVRGVRVLPEFDAPAHVGEGWQWTDFVVCLNAQPWHKFCSEPPCGQFDPTKPALYDTLEALYGDLVTQFEPDLFHMGGDEVHFGCWDDTENIVQWMKARGMNRTQDDFITLWMYFQTHAYERLQKNTKSKIPVILWTSDLTSEKYLHNLPQDDYIVQVWTTKNDRQIKNLINKGYKIILSNYDALYLDCGFASWTSSGNNWCSPYIGWQKVYENSPRSIITGENISQVLGSEATLWTEQVDDTSVDSRLWPRGSALAEQLWSEPSSTWMEAEQRFLIQRERLVSRGINADALEPEWCRQNEANCPANRILAG